MRVLVIAPHPDDETLGCGGTLLKHRAEGDQVCWLIVTRGHTPEWSTEVLLAKEAEIETVGAKYGFERTFRLNLPTTRIDTLPLRDVMSGIRGVIEEAAPDSVYCNHAWDVHSDHRVVFEATMSVLKPFYSKTHGVKRLLSYETLSSTDAMSPDVTHSFVPTVYSEITAYLDHKLEIMSLYSSEVQKYPLPRAAESIRALARFRGASIGVEYAEGFVMIRELM
jgi:LmbE family N-acetylglucosaminyl deacetylase